MLHLSIIVTEPKGFERGINMKANKIRMIFAVAVSSAVLALSGCGGNGISAVTENDSAVSDTEIAASSTTTSSSTEGEADVIAPQVVQPNAITLTPTPAEADSAAESVVPTAESEASSLAESNAESAAESTAEGESVGYTIAGINFRESASGSSDVIDTIEPGEEITVIGSTEGSWARIRYKGEEGYIASRFITTDADEAAEAKRSYDEDDDDDYDYSYRSYDDDDDE